jgi:FkbM family methyltransferase
MKTMKKWIRQIVWRRLNLHWTLPTGVRVRLDCRSDWDIYNEIFVDLDYDRAIIETLDSGGEPRILDLGANVGYFGLRWFHLAKERGQAGGEGIFVEGARDVYEMLVERLSLEKPPGVKAQFFHGLAGQRSGRGNLQRSAAHFGNSVGGEGGAGAEAVEYLDLDDLCDGWDRISLLKCDVEGSEEALLENYPMLLRKTDRLVIELHNEKVNIERCWELIEAAGFGVRVMIKERPGFCVAYCVRA